MNAAPATLASGRAEANSVKPTFSIDALDLLPTNRANYYLRGSLTTPPVSEGVTWIMMQQVLETEAATPQKVEELFHATTNRPTQPLFDRVIYSGG